MNRSASLNLHLRDTWDQIFNFILCYNAERIRGSSYVNNLEHTLGNNQEDPHENAVKLISLLTTLVTYLLHLHSGHDECALTKAQTNTITGAMAGGNSTYSMTLAPRKHPELNAAET